ADSHCRAVVIPHGAAVMPATNHQRELVIVVAAIVIAVPAVVVVPASVAVFPVAAHVSAVPVVRLNPVTTAERLTTPIPVLPHPESSARLPVAFNPLVAVRSRRRHHAIRARWRRLADLNAERHLRLRR